MISNSSPSKPPKAAAVDGASFEGEGEILKQAEQLSTDEQLELAARLMEQAQQTAEAPRNGSQIEGGDAGTLQTGAEEGLNEEAEEDEIPDVFSLNRVPPKRTYEMRVRYEFVGRGKPLLYSLDEEE